MYELDDRLPLLVSYKPLGQRDPPRGLKYPVVCPGVKNMEKPLKSVEEGDVILLTSIDMSLTAIATGARWYIGLYKESIVSFHHLTVVPL